MPRVELMRAWARRFERFTVELPEGACVSDALEAAGIHLEDPGAVAIHGVVATPGTIVREGDRIELLRPLLVDPKQARRRRARGGRG